MTKAALIALSPEMIGELLGLPNGQKVTRIGYDVTRDALVARIEGEGLVETPPSCEAPFLRVEVVRVTRPEARFVL